MTNSDPARFIPMRPTDFQVLLCLIRKPQHGYAIMRMVEEASGGRVRIAVGSLYRIIGRLLSSQLIDETDGPDDAPHPGKPRRSYALTPLGLAVARSEAERLRETLALVDAENLLPGVGEA